jgi:esterase FrsA
MNDVNELKTFAEVHARAQGIRQSRYKDVLRGIQGDDRGMPGSWVRQWCAVGERAELRGDLLEAFRFYNMARFPFVDGGARQYAHERCLSAFDRWRIGKDIERLEVDLDGKVIRCWAYGMSAHDQRPLLIIMGGIVTIKEQWAPVLLRVRRMGMAGIVAELPGVGENSLQYSADSWRMLPGMLDAVRGRADVTQTYAIAMSFSGHMALRAATLDPRIRGIVTAGAPVRDFFLDSSWQKKLPRITVATLAHQTGVPTAGLGEFLRDWAITKEQLASIDIPVSCLVSKRDEIIPRGDIRLLQSHVRRLRLAENDDLHGSPHHVAESRLWVAHSILGMYGAARLQRAALGTLLTTLRAAAVCRGTAAQLRALGREIQAPG